ncbi:Regulatory protein PchR [Thiorhodovibrio winogradskyi]|uniref:Regulatory protein PchR n=1 Tax=Thiorhodovibrio winogradskyi TaxID=77007 RepID=A0ABZ0SGT4_9GAMM
MRRLHGMKSRTAIEYRLHWLLVPEGPPGASAGQERFQVERVDYPLPQEIGQAWVNKLQLGDDVCLFHACHQFEKAPSRLLSLFEVDISPIEPLFNAQIWISGTACHREYWNGRDHPPVDILARSGRDTFRFHREWHATIMIEGGVYSEMRSIVIPEQSLLMMLGDEPVSALLDRLRIGHQTPTSVHSMPNYVSSPLRMALDSRHQGPARRLYAQGKVLEYLAGLYEFVSREEAPTKERRHSARIRELHDYLRNLEGHTPTPSQLSTDFGLSARRLNDDFVAEYGQSIFSFLTDYRLTQAHALLQADPIPLKVLAARLGYSHVNHFITAFKRKFGYTPGSLRRGR